MSDPIVRHGSPGGQRRRGQNSLTLAQTVGQQHGLVVLVLVLGDHRERECRLRVAVRDRTEFLQHPLTHLDQECARLPGAEQRQRCTFGPRVGEGVVEILDLGPQDTWDIAAAAQQPEVLLLADVREIPDQRAEQR